LSTSRVKLTRNTGLSLTIRILFLVALLLAVFSCSSAASLEGKVTEVFDGEDLAVFSQGHLVKVKLVAVASPDQKQSYAGIAHQHLSDLILNKYVVVRYSSLRDGYIVGQVMLGNLDIGAQMLRDGVGWYNKLDDASLSEVERQVYQGSQDAARNEHRGLWQEQSPVSPWDYRKSLLAPPPPPSTPVTYNTTQTHLPRLPSRGTQAGLSNEDLMGGVVRPGSIAGKPDVKPLFADGAPGRWLKYQPTDKHFSILAPSDGVEITFPVLDNLGKAIDLHYVIGHNGATLYFLIWTKGANGNSTDATTADYAIKGLLTGVNRTSGQSGLFVTATPGGELKLAGYAGREYTLDAGPASGVVRVLSKQIGDEREMFLLCVMHPADSETSGADFLNSFKIRQEVSKKAVGSGQ
jgi:endonuclease YncB( thermonuclease family)